LLLFTSRFLELNKKHNKWLFLAYIITIIYLLFAITLPQEFVKSVSQKFIFNFYADAGLLYYFFPILFSLQCIISITLLLSGFKTLSGEKRIQLPLLFWGVFIGYLGGGTAFPLVFNINLYPFGVWGLMVYVLLTSYSIAKLDFLESNLIIKKGVSFFYNNNYCFEYFYWRIFFYKFQYFCPSY